jgi:hypothetical protein
MTTDDTLLALSEMAGILNCSPETIGNWITKGLIPRGGGDRVKLHAVRVGKMLKTTRAWHAEFQTSLETGEPSGPTPRARERQAQRDMDALDKVLNKGKKKATRNI